MSQLTETILSTAKALPEGSPLNARQFLHLASRAAVDQALSRLMREGKLLRVHRGHYALPVHSRFGHRAPSTQALIKGLEATHGEIIVANGAAEANELGLTTQVPVREIFLTSGRTRTLRVGNRDIELKHAKRWQLAKQPAGKAIRALSWLGENKAPAALKVLRDQFPDKEWRTLQPAMATLPIWMARLIGEASARD
jgi:hypothetical protein